MVRACEQIVHMEITGHDPFTLTHFFQPSGFGRRGSAIPQRSKMYDDWRRNLTLPLLLSPQAWAEYSPSLRRPGRPSRSSPLAKSLTCLERLSSLLEETRVWDTKLRRFVCLCTTSISDSGTGCCRHFFLAMLKSILPVATLRRLAML